MTNVVSFCGATSLFVEPDKQHCRITGTISAKQAQLRVSLRSPEEAEVALSIIETACIQALAALKSSKRRRDPEAGLSVARAILLRANQLINAKRPGELRVSTKA